MEEAPASIKESKESIRAIAAVVYMCKDMLYSGLVIVEKSTLSVQKLNL